jgi:hypothetical protein
MGCGGQSGTGAFFHRALRFPCQLFIPPIAAYHNNNNNNGGSSSNDKNKNNNNMSPDSGGTG